MPLTEADTCRKFVVPKLQAAGWDTEPHSIAEQRTITDGRIVPVGKGFIRKPPKRRGLPAALHARFPPRRRRGQGRLENRRRWPAAGQGIRRDPRPEVRLRDQRPRDHRVRLLHRPGNASSRPTRPRPSCGQRYRAGNGICGRRSPPRACSPP